MGFESLPHHILWRSLDGIGLEYLTLAERQGGIAVQSTVIGMKDEPSTLRYNLQLDRRWQVRQVELRLLGHESSLNLTSDGKGRWSNAAGDLPELNGCLDADISATPFTNTLPVRRLGLAAGEAAEIAVVYLTVPTLSFRVGHQRYTHLKDRLYLYENLSSGYRAEIEVDGAGLVVRYPGLFERLYG